MAELKTSVIVPDIQQVVQQVVAQFHPERIILFGSYAYGQPHEGSDLDLLVIVSNPSTHRENWKSAHELRQYSALPLQVFFISPEEFEETKNVVGGLAYPAHHWGKVLYEANS